MQTIENFEVKNISLTEEDIKIILECILFSTSIDISASWYKEDTDKMLDLAKKIRMQHSYIPVENIFISQLEEISQNFLDEQTEKIVEMFPEIQKVENNLI